MSLFEVTTDALAPSELDALSRHEATIERGLQTFVDVGTSLMAIRDGRLYRQQYATFEEYCRERWGLKQSRAYQMMDAAATVANLTSTNVELLPSNEAQARALTKLEPEQQRQAWRRAVETAPNGKVTGAHVEQIVREMNGPEDAPKQERMAVHYSSDSPEWYTPSHVIYAVLETLGEIDLDPCSNSHDNPNVPAAEHFTESDNGLGQRWRGRVYMNPPYGREIVKWIDKLRQEFEAGFVSEAVALVPSRTDTAWFHSMRDYAKCFIRGRLNFSEHDTSAPFPSVAIYLGSDVERFRSAFADLGDVYLRLCDGTAQLLRVA